MIWINSELGEPAKELNMRVMVLNRPGAALVLRECPIPQPGPGEILIEIEACGVCRTDLHVVDGELPHLKLPIVPGHEIVGRVAGLGSDVTGFARGERVGVPWLGATCGVCPYCRDGRENLCDRPLFTGYTRDGGYATHTLADCQSAIVRPLDASHIRRQTRFDPLPLFIAQPEQILAHDPDPLPKTNQNCIVRAE